MRSIRGRIAVALAVVGMVFLLAGCPSGGQSSAGNQSATDKAIAKANSNQVYIPQNNLELKNYNARQKIADNPATILWCTSSFPIPSSPIFTVPIQGKLTSADKRPFSTARTEVGFGDGSGDTYSPEIPGPDGMYGSSEGAYRYGFTPAGVYVEFSQYMPTLCTTEPMVWQRQSTTLVSGADQTLLNAQKQAQALIEQGKQAEAAQVLNSAIASEGGK